jgi:hypothetical protein
MMADCIPIPARALRYPTTLYVVTFPPTLDPERPLR